MSDERYRAIPFESYRINSGYSALLPNGFKCPVEAKDEIASLLSHCSSFRSLDDHLATYLQTNLALIGQRSPRRFIRSLTNFLWNSVSSADPKDLHFLSKWNNYRTFLEQLVKQNLLVSETDLRAQISHEFTNDNRQPISYLCIPTVGRTKLLQRCLESYCNNAQYYGRPLTVLVAADCGASELQGLVEQQSHKSSSCIWMTPSHREDLARSIARRASIPEEVLLFGLLGLPTVRWKAGAVRNSLLLATIGAKSINVDDDTLCSGIMATGQSSTNSTVTTINECDPTQFWFYADKESLHATASFTNVDFVGYHEAFLGRRLGSAFLDSNRTTIRELCSCLLNDLYSGSGIIALTHTGLAGDSGMSSSGSLYGVEGESRTRMLGTEKTYTEAMLSRQIVRMTPEVSIGHGTLCMSTMIGLDNRQLLPPFLPTFRNDDGLFGQMLKVCFDGYYTCYLPLAMRHEPQEQRSYPEETDSFVFIYASVLFQQCVHEMEKTLKHYPGGESRLRVLGEHFINIGQLPATTFRNYIRKLALSVASTRLRYLDGSLHRHSAKPTYWANGLRSVMGRLKTAMFSNGYEVPIDLSNVGSDEERMQILRSTFYDYGRLVCLWPTVRKIASQMRFEAKNLIE